MRAAICEAVSMGGVTCEAAKLKLAVYPAENPILVDETSPDLQKSRPT